MHAETPSISIQQLRAIYPPDKPSQNALIRSKQPLLTRSMLLGHHQTSTNYHNTKSKQLDKMSINFSVQVQPSHGYYFNAKPGIAASEPSSLVKTKRAQSVDIHRSQSTPEALLIVTHSSGNV